jgi:hypothetical protein
MHSPVKLRANTMFFDGVIDGYAKAWSPESQKKRYKITAEQCACWTGSSGYMLEESHK